MLARVSWERVVIAAGPAVLTVYLCFSSGGFFAGAPALAATVLGLALVFRILTAEEPFAGFGLGLIAAMTALGLFAVWTLVSFAWSDAPAQAMIEFDRVLLYWLALVLFGTLPHDREAMALAVRALAAAIVMVALAGLITRLLPDVWEQSSGIENNRLGYPLTYWNALGIIAATGIVLCTHIASVASESRLARCLAAAALPALGATLYFTFSRGAILAAAIGLVAYAVVARPRGLLSTALAAVPVSAGLLVLCYGADLLASGDYATPAGVSQGHEIAAVLVGAMVAAGLLRFALDGTLDPAIRRISIPRTSMATALVGLALAAVLVAIVADLPGRIGDQYENFTAGDSIDDSGDLRGRLTSVGNNGRLDQWDVALDTFAANPLNGEGAGTFSRVWAQDGTDELKVEDAHSLYLEVMAELGLIGLMLLLGAIVALLVSFARCSRGPGNEVYAALLAAGLLWALHAGVDWDWEMPATGIWLFALGGYSLAGRPEAGVRFLVPGGFARLVLAVGALALIVTPALMVLSQARLDSSVEALRADDCTTAGERALAAARWVPPRPEPFQILSFCNSKAGENDLAIEMAKAAVSRDPQDWSLHYTLALVQAAAGVDPRPAAARALELNPLGEQPRKAVRGFDTDDPEKWRRRALSTRLPIL